MIVLADLISVFTVEKTLWDCPRVTLIARWLYYSGDCEARVDCTYMHVSGGVVGDLWTRVRPHHDSHQPSDPPVSGNVHTLRPVGLSAGRVWGSVPLERWTSTLNSYSPLHSTVWWTICRNKMISRLGFCAVTAALLISSW